MKMNKILGDVTKVLSGGASTLSLYTWYESLNQPTIKNIHDTLIEYNKKLDDTLNGTESSLILKNKTTSIALELEEYINSLKNTYNKYYLDNEEFINCSAAAGDSKGKTLEAITQEQNNQYAVGELGRLISKTITKSEELLKLITETDISKNFIGDLNLLELYNDFQAYLQTLSTYQLCILFNITTIIFIMTCLITIIFSFYGDFFITKLKLEEKYPKIAGFIRLRRLFVHFYLLTNTIFITLALSVMMFVNCVTFFN